MARKQAEKLVAQKSCSTMAAEKWYDHGRTSHTTSYGPVHTCSCMYMCNCVYRIVQCMCLCPCMSMLGTVSACVCVFEFVCVALMIVLFLMTVFTYFLMAGGTGPADLATARPIFSVHLITYSFLLNESRRAI